MAITQSEKLVERARSGEQLTSKERRVALAFLIATQPELTNTAIADVFRVSEKLVRMDKKYIRGERAKLIQEDDVGLVIADVTLSFENQVADIEASKKECAKGSRDYLEHCKAIFNFQLAKIKALQDLGYLPKNLGSMTIDKFEYKAIVTKDGSVNTRPVHMQTYDDVIDAEVVEQVVDQKLIEAPDEGSVSAPE
jgi:hypothetical protein